MSLLTTQQQLQTRQKQFGQNKEYFTDESDENKEKSKDNEDEENPRDLSTKLLKLWGLGEYVNVMIMEMGYEFIDAWPSITDDILKDMGYKPGHIHQFRLKLDQYLKK